MKTLKKSLCLVLALVMVLGFGMVSASAKLDYEDAKDITYAEQVDVLSGIGVLEGYTDGTFLPKQEVTREEAAKIIAYLMVGNAKQADALSTTADPFSDVSKDRWSAGYIAYLVQAGVIDGMGNGSFDPTGKVTGLQFAKMLLTALGYGVNDEYVGENWAINVAKDALQYGIFDGNLAGANNTAATREECALYAFNTLWLQKVTYSALLGGYIEDTFYANAESNKSNTYANDYNLTTADLDDDDFMRPQGYVYKVGKKTITEAYGVDDTLVASYTTPVTGNEVYLALGASAAKRANATIYVDGVDPEDFDYSEQVVKSNTNNIKYSGYGVQTYVYDLGSETRIVMINTYLAQVTDVVAESKTRDAKTTLDVMFEKDTPEEKTYADDSFEEGDLVLVTYSKLAKAIESVEAANETKGIVTKYANKGTPQVTVEDTSYYATANAYIKGLDVVAATDAADVQKEQVNGDEYTVILDAYGYFFGITGKAATPNKYVFVKEFGYKFDLSDTLKDELALTARVITPDGETKDLFVTYKKNAGDDSQTLVTTFAQKAMDNGEETYVSELSDITAATNKTGLYEATYTDSTVRLIKAATDIGPYDVYKSVTRLGTGTEYVTKSTVLYFVTYNAAGTAYSTVTPYVGINTVPTLKTGDAQAVAGVGKAAGANTVYSAVVVEDNRTPTYSSTVYYYVAGSYTKTDNKDGTYTATYDVINTKSGDKEQISYTFKSEADASTSIDEAAAGFVTEGKGSVNTLVAATGYGTNLAAVTPATEVTDLTSFSVGVDKVITMFVDNSTLQGYAIEDAIIRGKASSAADLAKLVATYDHVEVVFIYNTKTMQATFVYVTSATNDPIAPPAAANTMTYYLQVSRLDSATLTIVTETYKLGTQDLDVGTAYDTLADLKDAVDNDTLTADGTKLVSGAPAVIVTYGDTAAYTPTVIVDSAASTTTFQVYIP